MTNLLRSMQQCTLLIVLLAALIPRCIAGDTNYPFCDSITLQEEGMEARIWAWNKPDQPHSPCRCDELDKVCYPNEICQQAISLADQTEADEEDPEKWNQKLQECQEDFDSKAGCRHSCRTLPCSDMNGDWVWIGRNPRPFSSGNFTVWGTVSISQVGCWPVLTFTSQVGSDGNWLASPQTRTMYASPPGFSFFVFPTPVDDAQRPWSSYNGYRETYNFIQNFGDDADPTHSHCTYFGSFVVPGDVSELPDDANAYSGLLARDVAGVYKDRIGEIIPEAEVVGDSRHQHFSHCPEGYPRDMAYIPNNTTGRPGPAQELELSTEFFASETYWIMIGFSAAFLSLLMLILLQCCRALQASRRKRRRARDAAAMDAATKYSPVAQVEVDTSIDQVQIT